MTDRVFIDTSALHAALDGDDEFHVQAATGWELLFSAVDAGTIEPITHYGVVVESSALVQRRLGLEALRDLHTDLLGVVTIRWVDDVLHRRALSAVIAAGRRDVSLVDWTSFEVMRELAIDRAFSFDSDFTDQGFESWE